jgi:hypothetical protein
MRDKQQVIDEVLATLFESNARGYFATEKSTLTAEAKKRILRSLSTLDNKTRTGILSDADYRLERFGKFKELPVDQRSEILKIAKEKQIPIEKAYELSDASRN